jgi:predicted nucleic acid-binding protein
MPSSVVDANGAIGLSKGGVFHLLASLYDAVYVSPGVVSEVIAQGQGLSGSSELSQALGVWVTEVTPDPTLVPHLSPSLRAVDREVLAIAHEQKVDHIVSSDRHIRREARRLGIRCHTVTEILLVLKAAGLLPAICPVLDTMRQNGFGIDDAAYEQALLAAGEARAP